MGTKLKTILSNGEPFSYQDRAASEFNIPLKLSEVFDSDVIMTMLLFTGMILLAFILAILRK